jgi:simple sugar transport system ATP-binding protein
MSHPALELRNIGKSYYGTRVLKDVSLEVRPGEIHALVGENGAGKSTLMNILFGMPVIHETGGYEGSIVLGGETVAPRSPSDAMAHGVGMVHQEFMLLPGFTITENVKLNRERTRPNLVSRALAPVRAGNARALESLDMPAMRADTRRALERIGMSLDESLPVAGLPVGHMQFVEIAREVDKENARVIVFDEPTAVLTENEAEDLLAAARALAGAGIAILFISHRLDEVLAVADRITVLRDGAVVGRLDRGRATVETVAELMIGRTLGERQMPPRGRGAGDEPLLSIRDLHVDMPGEGVHGANLEVRKGEILGIGGLAGQGKLGIANGVMGLYPARGRAVFEGREIPLGSPRSALGMGLAFVSEDRRGVGLLLDESVERNITSTAVQVQGRFLNGRGALALLDGSAARSHARDMIREFDIRCRGPRQAVRRLSGGNQQKVCLARAFTLAPDLLFVSEPTRGIDVGAKDLVLNLLVAMNREKGTTVVLTSSELAELRGICDRIAIVYGGRVAGILAPGAPDVEFGLLMGGGAR